MLNVRTHVIEGEMSQSVFIVGEKNFCVSEMIFIKNLIVDKYADSMNAARKKIIENFNDNELIQCSFPYLALI